MDPLQVPPYRAPKDIRGPSASVAIESKGSPIFGVTIPAGYRKWELIALSHRPDFDPFRHGSSNHGQGLKKVRSTGGRGFGRFIDGKPVDEAQHKTCSPATRPT